MHADALPPIPRFEIDARVVAHNHILGHEFEIVFHAPLIATAAQPGQFLELLFGENYMPLVRRPFSLYRVDREAGTFSVLYLARGSFTTGLAHRQVGDVVSVLGPLGQPFRWQPDEATRHILVAGGIGAPPLYFLAREMRRELEMRGENADRVVVINGARTRDLLVATVEFGALDITLHLVTDDGSHGRRGLTTEMLTTLLDAEIEAESPAPIQIYACGPMPMLRAIGQVALSRNLPCQVSIETSMPCGIGICQGCAIKVQDAHSPDGFRYALACRQGPVFEARELVWD